MSLSEFRLALRDHHSTWSQNRTYDLEPKRSLHEVPKFIKYGPNQNASNLSDSSIHKFNGLNREKYVDRKCDVQSTLDYPSSKQSERISVFQKFSIHHLVWLSATLDFSPIFVWSRLWRIIEWYFLSVMESCDWPVVRTAPAAVAAVVAGR